MTPQSALLLINLGTPQSPEPPDVKKYLDEFLMDPLVIDIPFLARWFLVKGIILNTRPKKSSEAYKKIWTDRGSPLLWHSQDLANRVQDRLYPRCKVFLAMRYGEPSIRGVLEEVRRQGFQDLMVIPLYPQYSLAATQSSLDEVNRCITKMKWKLKSLESLRDFHDEGGFVASFRERIVDERRTFAPDHVLFSYHGVPERHCLKTDSTGGKHCFSGPHCCDTLTDANRNCYRAQCFATTRALARALNLSPTEHSVSFQSRLGRTPWIKPFTDEELPKLVQRGCKRILVACPSFVADCLETLEEITIRAREDFIKAGGEDLRLVPSLNSTPVWADAVASMAESLGS